MVNQVVRERGFERFEAHLGKTFDHKNQGFVTEKSRGCGVGTTIQNGRKGVNMPRLVCLVMSAERHDQESWVTEL